MEGGPLASRSRSPGRESTQRLCTCFTNQSFLFEGTQLMCLANFNQENHKPFN